MAYPKDLAFREKILELLGTVWSMVPPGVDRARAWGADWCEESTPFVHIEDDKVVAHIGVMEIPLVTAEGITKVAGIHAVCTRKDWRKRGLMGALMNRTLAWVDEHYKVAVLWANDANIYKRFGFEARPEHMFQGPMAGASARVTRRLSLNDAADLALFRQIASTRTPASSISGSLDPGWLSLINLGLWTPPGPAIDWVDDLQCIVIYEVRGTVLRIYDILGEAMPPLGDIASRLGPSFDRVVVFFSPDKLDSPALDAVPSSLYDTLMVRGPVLPAQDGSPRPLAFSPLTRC